MVNNQFDLFLDDGEVAFVKASHSDLGPFGNQVDLVVVSERKVTGMSLLEPATGVVHVDGQGIISHSEDDSLDV